MTLAELVPSLGAVIGDRVDARLWPSGTVARGGDLVVGGVAVSRVAARFGTPAYLLDEAEVRARCRWFRDVLPEAEVVFAAKALSCRAVLRWVAEEGLSVDVCSAGELAVAKAAGVPGGRILLHGNVKTPDDLKAAVAHGVGRIVVDSLDEVEQVAAVAHAGQRVLIRVTPDVDAGTHRAITTGVAGQKFGFSFAEAEIAVRRIAAHPNLRLVGLHCHIGSQVRRVAAYEQAARRMVAFLARLRDVHGVTVEELDLGGGFAVPHLPGEDEFDLGGYAARVRCALRFECARLRVPVPALLVEPGRSVVATAGLTLYRVVVVKGSFVAVDGGMSDNARPSLYGARYTARLVGRSSTAPRRVVTVVGRHCEAGDVLAEDVPLPGDVRAGDVLAVPVTGAYHHSLASNYNQVCRPPVIGLRDGVATVLVRGETEDDLLRRDVG
jgi:diaminopimelate decarboxylase